MVSMQSIRRISDVADAPFPRAFMGSAQMVFGVFAAGIALGAVSGIDPWFLCAGALIGLVGAAMMRSKRTVMFLVLAGVCLAGMMAWAVQHTVRGPWEPLPEIVNRVVSVSGVVCDAPRSRSGLTVFDLACDSLYFRGTTYPAQGMLAVSIPDGVVFEGDRIMARGILRSSPEPIAGWWSPLTSDSHTRSRLNIQGVDGGLVVVRHGSGVFGRLRTALGERIARFRFGGYGGLFAAMTIGDTSHLDPAQRERFADAGLAHLLAVSGLHAGLVGLVLGVLLTLFRTGRRTRTVLLIAGLLIYAGICGFRPPVVRAALMCGLVMTGRLMERHLDGEHVLAIAGLAILAFDPSALFGLSFQLSFTAVWAIVVLYPPLYAFLTRRISVRWRRHMLVQAVFGSALVSFLAVIGTAPVAASAFGRLPLLSVPVNMAAVPLMSGILICGGSAVMLSYAGLVGMAPAIVCDAFAGWLLRALVWIGDTVSSLPFATIDTGLVTPFLALSMLLWLFFLSRSAGRPPAARVVLYLPLTVMLVMVWLPVALPVAGMSGGQAVFFDVGQGDAALFSTGDQVHLLIDAGPPGTGRVIAESLDALGIDRLDGILLSHFDADHAGGLADILDVMPVGRVFCRSEAADSLGAVLGCPVTGLAAGDSVGFSGGGMLVLSPGGTPGSGYDENDRSLVIRCNTGGFRVLFTGDIGSGMQWRLAGWGDTLSSAVVKVPHHGSRPAIPVLYDVAAPRMAVISCGLNNTYGHPAAETVAMLDSLGVTVCRTSRDGHLRITSGFAGIEVDALRR